MDRSIPPSVLTPLRLLSSRALVPLREAARPPSQEEAWLPMLGWLKLSGVFAESVDPRYVDKLERFLRDKEEILLDAYNGHNGARLKLPLTVSAKNAKSHRFFNKVTGLPGTGVGPSTYDLFCRKRYWARLVHPEGVLISDANGNLVAIEAIHVLISTPCPAFIPRTPVSRARVLKNEKANVMHIYPTHKLGAARLRGVVTENELSTLFSNMRM